MAEGRDNVAGIMLRDGPCSGAWSGSSHHFEAPFPTYITVVKDRESGEVDVLDLPDDSAKLTEDVHRYRIDREAGAFHVCARGPGSAGSGWFVWAVYDPED
jgi:hypothetical protein